LQARAVATRATIIEAAATVFAAHGYAETTIDRILDEAGVTRGALYFHYKSKADLARAVLMMMRERRAALWAAVETEGDRNGWSVVERMHQVASRIAQEYVSSIVLVAAMRLEDGYAALESEDEPPVAGWMAWLDGMLRRAQAAGEIPATTDRDDVARTILASIYGLDRLCLRLGQRREDFPLRVEAWWRLFEPGLTGAVK